MALAFCRDVQDGRVKFPQPGSESSSSSCGLSEVRPWIERLKTGKSQDDLPDAAESAPAAFDECALEKFYHSIENNLPGELAMLNSDSDLFNCLLSRCM